MRTQIIIDLNYKSGSTLQFYDPTNTGNQYSSENNVSNASLVLNNSNAKGYKGFQLSSYADKPVSTLDGSYKLFDSKGIRAFVSSALSDAEGKFTSTQMLQLLYIGNADDEIYVTFNPFVNEYASLIRVDYCNADGTSVSASEYTNDSPTFAIGFEPFTLTPGEIITCMLRITFVEWNKPYKSVFVAGISTSAITSYSGSDLIDFTCSENLMDAQMQISPGIVEQYADVRVYDRDNRLHTLAVQDKLHADSNLSILAIDQEDNEHKLGTYRVDEWLVDANDSVVTIYCGDITKNIGKITMPPLEVADRSLHQMLSTGFQYIQNAAWIYIDSETEEYCKAVITPDSWTYKQNVKDYLHNVCTMGLLRIYWYIDKFIVARCY